jgi:alanine racemase
LADPPGGPPATRTGTGGRGFRPAWAEIDLDAVRHNVGLLRRLCAPSQVCAVVKANGYGHGAVHVGRAALEAGASWLAVATVEEGVELREAGIEASVLVLSEPPPAAMEEMVRFSLTPTIYSRRAVQLVSEAASRAGANLDVHLKLDTGMHRVGAQPEELDSIVSTVKACGNLRVGGLWTHLPVAEGLSEPDREFTNEQLDRFGSAAEKVAAAVGEKIVLHAANSAATLCFPRSRLDMVRCGIAVYGSPPHPSIGAEAKSLRPAMSLKAEVCHLTELDAGERPSYGRLRPLPGRSVVATVPLGYADGVPRRLFEAGATVLVGGRRRPLAGAVTMDQIVVDCAGGSGVSVGDEVVLIGEQGGEEITAWEWAEELGTISYEVLARIGPRVPRVFVGETTEQERS